LINKIKDSQSDLVKMISSASLDEQYGKILAMIGGQ